MVCTRGGREVTQRRMRVKCDWLYQGTRWSAGWLATASAISASAWRFGSRRLRAYRRSSSGVRDHS